jgi:hypothetical protein
MDLGGETTTNIIHHSYILKLPLDPDRSVTCTPQSGNLSPLQKKKQKKQKKQNKTKQNTIDQNAELYRTNTYPQHNSGVERL